MQQGAEQPGWAGGSAEWVPECQVLPSSGKPLASHSGTQSHVHLPDLGGHSLSPTSSSLQGWEIFLPLPLQDEKVLVLLARAPRPNLKLANRNEKAKCVAGFGSLTSGTSRLVKVSQPGDCFHSSARLLGEGGCGFKHLMNIMSV